MIEKLLSYTSLPNLHPAVVHFPIALWPLAVLADMLWLVAQRPAWLERAATAGYVGGALAGWAAYAAGRQAEEALLDVPAHVQPAIAAHADQAFWTLLAFGAVAALRLGTDLFEHCIARGVLRITRWLVWIGALIALVLIFRTADLGGALVYRYGVAVAAGDAPPAHALSDRPGPPGPRALEERHTEELETSRGRLLRDKGGALSWNPSATDRTALGVILSWLEGSLDTVRIAREESGAARGLPLEVAGRAVLVFPETFGDVQVEATLEPERFEGSVGLAHHIAGPDRVELFKISTRGNASLVLLSGGEEDILDSGTWRRPPGPFSVAISASGVHLKGMVDGAVVAHGHRPTPPPGKVGLFLEGSGVIRLLSVRVIPLTGP